MACARVAAQACENGVSDEGGFAPDLKSNEEAVRVIRESGRYTRYGHLHLPRSGGQRNVGGRALQVLQVRPVHQIEMIRRLGGALPHRVPRRPDG